MCENEDLVRNIRARHLGDLKTLWAIFNIETKWYRAPYLLITFLISIIIVLLVTFSETGYFKILELVIGTGISVLPNLLGFNLGAYILVVGFGSTDILKDITEPLENSRGYSLYQILSGVFGVSVLFQVFTLIAFFLIAFIMRIDASISLPGRLLETVNGTMLLLLITALLYSVFLLVSVVKHVFLFSQTVHFIIAADKYPPGQLHLLVFK